MSSFLITVSARSMPLGWNLANIRSSTAFVSNVSRQFSAAGVRSSNISLDKKEWRCLSSGPIVREKRKRRAAPKRRMKSFDRFESMALSQSSGDTNDFMEDHATDPDPNSTPFAPEESSFGMAPEKSSFGKTGKSADNFVGTRVFVQGIPLHSEWQEVKDHFKEYSGGSVAYASVSYESTGKSKGCGIVQFETEEDALRARKVMRDHPMKNLDGEKSAGWYVREDVQEKRGNRRTWDLPQRGAAQERRPPRKDPEWRCADEATAIDTLTPDDLERVKQIVREREGARRDRDWDASDGMREDLRNDYKIRIDDRLKMWWVDCEDGVPQLVQDMKGSGGWGTTAKSKEEWRLIPTTRDNDANVDVGRVARILADRDKARRTKHFSKADALLEEAKTSPLNGFELRIHDDSRTFRVWTKDKPNFSKIRDEKMTRRGARQSKIQESNGNFGSDYERAIALVMKFEPQKIDEIKEILKKFPGKEKEILRKMEDRFYE